MAKPYWWARAKDIKHMGPFKTQELAWAGVMGLDGTPVEGAIVWYGPEPKDSPLLIRDKKLAEHRKRMQPVYDFLQRPRR